MPEARRLLQQAGGDLGRAAEIYGNQQSAAAQRKASQQQQQQGIDFSLQNVFIAARGNFVVTQSSRPGRNNYRAIKKLFQINNYSLSRKGERLQKVKDFNYFFNLIIGPTAKVKEFRPDSAIFYFSGIRRVFRDRKIPKIPGALRAPDGHFPKDS